MANKICVCTVAKLQQTSKRVRERERERDREREMHMVYPVEPEGLAG
jgi:hypothetical protein